MQDDSLESDQDSFASDSEEEDGSHSDREDEDSSHSDQEDGDSSFSDREVEDEDGFHSDRASCFREEVVLEAPKELDEMDAKLRLTNQKTFDGGAAAFREEEDPLQLPRGASRSGEEGLPEAPKQLEEVDAKLELSTHCVIHGEQEDMATLEAPYSADKAVPEAPREPDEEDANLEFVNQYVRDGITTLEEEDMPEAPSEAQKEASSSADETAPAFKTTDEADATQELASQGVCDGVTTGEEEDMPEGPSEARPKATLQAPSGDEAVPAAPREADEADANLDLASQYVLDGVITGEEEDMPEAPPEAHSEAHAEADHRLAEQAEDPAEHRRAGSPADLAEVRPPPRATDEAEDTAAEQAADLADSEDEIWTDEGRAFALALKEAQAALDAARQFVVSPWDRKSIAAPPPPPARNMEDWEAPDAPEAPAVAAATAIATPSPLAADVPENDASTSKDPPDAGSDPVAETKLLAEPVASAAAPSPRVVAGRHRAPSPSGVSKRHGAPSPSGVSKRHGAARDLSPSVPPKPGARDLSPRVPPKPAARDLSPRVPPKPAARDLSPGVPQPPTPAACDLSPRDPEPPRPVADLNELHVRYGENAARVRVERAHTMDRAQNLRTQAEAAAKAAMAAEKGTVVEASRRQAGRRAASERRAKQVAEQKDREERLLELARRESDARAGKRYAVGAARRAHSEKSREEVMLQEVLSDLGTVQSQRREAAERSGRELQRRCKEADWSQAQPAVQSRRQRSAHPPAPMPAQPSAPPVSRRSGKGLGSATGAVGGRSSASLPLLPKLLPPEAQMPTAAPSAGMDLRLPPLAPSARVH